MNGIDRSNWPGRNQCTDPNHLHYDIILVYNHRLRRNVEWFDVEFLHDCGIAPLGEDTRTPEELAARYLPFPI